MTELWCTTCREYEPHRPVEGEREKNWVRKRIDKGEDAFVDDYWMCEKRGCRNVRYRWSTTDAPGKMPPLD